MVGEVGYLTKANHARGGCGISATKKSVDHYVETEFEAKIMEKLAQMLVEWEITKLVKSFNFFLDQCRYDDLISLFTDDGEFDRLGQVLKGRDAIKEAYLNRHPFLTRHFVANLLFTRLEESEAEATMYVADFVGQPATNGLPVIYHLPQPALIEFDDLYRLTDSGWRIHKRRASLVMKSANQ